MDQDAELQRIKDAVAGEGSDRSLSRKLVVAFAAVAAGSLAVAFLGFLAIKIGALPLIVIIFGVLSLMVYDLFDTLRAMIRGGNGNNNGNGQTASGG